MGSVGPTSPPIPGSSIWGPHPKSRASANARSSSSNQDEASAAAQASTQAAQDQVARSQQAIADAQQDADQNLEHIRQGYDQASMAESNNEEDALAKQKLKGYEALRDLKRQQDSEINRVRRDGERELKGSQDYYRDTIYSQSRKADQDLQEIKAKQGREMQYVSTTGQSDLDLQKGEQIRKIEDLKHNQDEQFTQLSSSAHTEYERQKANTAEAQQKETEHFNSNYKSTIDADQQSLDDLNSKAGTQIRQIRQDTAQKLAAYSSRQSDPFYKMVDLNAQLSDEGDRYVLRAAIPTHEQDHVAVALKGNILVLSGARRNEEKLDLGPGKFKGTSSYQSFQESFPLALPVDRNGLTKEFRGDEVIITIPKMKTGSYYEAYQSKIRPQRLRAERPHFPGNLPGVSPEGASPSASEEASRENSDKKSGRTLT